MHMIMTIVTFLLINVSVCAQQISASPLTRLYAANVSASPYERMFDNYDLVAVDQRIQVKLIVGEIEQILGPGPHPDAVIVPTNTNADLRAPFPITQRVVNRRLSLSTNAQLLEAIARRRTEHGGDAPIMIRAIDSLTSRLRDPNDAQALDNSPDKACLIATDFPQGGSIADRDFFQQDKIQLGISRCLTELSSLNAKLVATPLIGSASFATGDTATVNQRLMLQCRLINSISGITRGISAAAQNKTSVTEIGVIIWRTDLEKLFGLKPTGTTLSEFERFSSRTRAAFERGLKGSKTTVEDVGVADCLRIFGER